MDDVDMKDGEWLVGFLKRWSDRYPCLLEKKGSTTTKRYKNFIITSNHSLDDVFKNAKKTDVDALKRRFEVIHMLNN